jgi:hypothetical protein
MMTGFFAKLIGFWIALTVVGMAFNRDASLSMLNAFFADPAILFVTGVFTTLFGLTVVLLHNRWTGGAVAALVTLYGWAALVKGALLLLLPASAQLPWYRALHFEQFFYTYLGVAFVLGAYLVYGGYRVREPAQG